MLLFTSLKLCLRVLFFKDLAYQGNKMTDKTLIIDVTCRNWQYPEVDVQLAVEGNFFLLIVLNCMLL